MGRFGPLHWLPSTTPLAGSGGLLVGCAGTVRALRDGRILSRDLVSDHKSRFATASRRVRRVDSAPDLLRGLASNDGAIERAGDQPDDDLNYNIFSAVNLLNTSPPPMGEPGLRSWLGVALGEVGENRVRHRDPAELNWPHLSLHAHGA